MAQQLTGKGFQNVYVLKGGFEAWQQAGMPTEPKKPFFAQAA